MNPDKLSETEIDSRVVAQAGDETAWSELKHVESGSRERFLKAVSKVPDVIPTKMIGWIS
jgi:hypothetical protein